MKSNKGTINQWSMVKTDRGYIFVGYRDDPYGIPTGHIQTSLVVKVYPSGVIETLNNFYTLKVEEDGQYKRFVEEVLIPLANETLLETKFNTL